MTPALRSVFFGAVLVLVGAITWFVAGPASPFTASVRTIAAALLIGSAIMLGFSAWYEEAYRKMPGWRARTLLMSAGLGVFGVSSLLDPGSWATAAATWAAAALIGTAAFSMMRERWART